MFVWLKQRNILTIYRQIQKTYFSNYYRRINNRDPLLKKLLITNFSKLPKTFLKKRTSAQTKYLK